MTKNEAWFTSFKKTHLYKSLLNHPVAYFCAEYALGQDMPTYAGGLGVLAGDMVREAKDRNFPMVAVGLYYHKGYTRQKFYNKKQLEYIGNPANMGLKIVEDKKSHKPLLIKVPMQDRDVFAIAWLWEKDTVPVYLLDTNVNENSPQDRLITENLYDADLQTRLRQEILLGIGGYRLLQALNIQPSIYHMNEGHSAFLALEVISSVMRTLSISCTEAREVAKKNIVFTNHTLVAAGHDNFVNDLVSLLLERYAQQIQIPITELVSLGLVKNSDVFSMTMLSLRSAGGVNAVSQLHAQKANEIWTNHPMVDVTNGVHVPSWDMIDDENSLWQSHQKNKKKLVSMINKTSSKKWRENELLIGWARRVVGYKRPLAIFSDLERIKKIAGSRNKPVNIFFAGLYHSDDQEGVAAVSAIKKYAAKELKGNLAFVDDYNTGLAHYLTSGADIWLNTPVVGFEACGTSGMKAALNGALNFSTKDGWLFETDIDQIGWEIDDRNIKTSIYDILEKEIVPTYYDDGRITELWKKKMKTARNLVQNNFSAARMLKDYIEKIYSKLI
jgi:starch phosphorylase